MKKKGFTLIELLAVIAILAILVIVAVPNIMNMFQSAKKGTFVTQAQNIFKSAENTYLSDQLDPTTAGAKRYCYKEGTQVGGTIKQLDLSGSKKVYYDISVDASGNVTSFKITDGSFSISTTGTALSATDLIKTLVKVPADTTDFVAISGIDCL